MMKDEIKQTLKDMVEIINESTANSYAAGTLWKSY